jgi:membrane protease YdiL (CAAX protease family)
MGMKSRVIQADPPTPPTAPAPIAWVRNHRLVTFFVLAYALSWGALPWNSFFAPGVLIAALLVAYAADGWAGLRDIGARLIRWRVGWVWYVVAIAVPLLIHLVTISVNLAAGAPGPDLSQFNAWYSLPLAIAINIVNPTGGQLSEEPSFRGFALPILQGRHGKLGSAAIMGVLVTGWHLPLYFMPSFNLKPIEILATIAVTFWYTWLFNRASGSSLITLIAHAAEGGVATAALWTVGAASARTPYVYTLVWVAFAAGLVVVQWKYWWSPPEPAAVRTVSTTDSVRTG